MEYIAQSSASCPRDGTPEIFDEMLERTGKEYQTRSNPPTRRHKSDALGVNYD